VIELLFTICLGVGAFVSGAMFVFAMLGRAEKRRVKNAVNEIINTKRFDPKIFADRD
jgi:hypothetical protein